MIGVPTVSQRLEILKCLTDGLPLSPDVKLDALAEQCLGYVTADLTALVQQSMMNALRTALSSTGLGNYDFTHTTLHMFASLRNCRY